MKAIARLVLRVVVLGLIIALVAKIVPGIHVHGGFFTFVWLGFLFSVVNTIIGPLLKLLSLPLIVLTAGLFLLIINAALLAITAGISSRLSISGFVAAVLGGLLIAIFTSIAQIVLPLRDRSD